MDLSLFDTISCSTRMVIRNKKEAIPKRSNKNNAMSAAHVEAKGTSDATEVGL